MPKKSDRKLIGLTGTNAAGKGEIARLLRERGFAYLSLSDVLRDEAKNAGLPASREVLIDLGRKLRDREGPGTLAARTVAKLESKKYVIDSVRSPTEIRVLRAAGNFLLLAVDAPVDLRFERAKARGRIENAGTLKEFQKLEAMENSNVSNAQQIDLCLLEADRLFVNDATLEKLEKDVIDFLKSKSFI